MRILLGTGQVVGSVMTATCLFACGVEPVTLSLPSTLALWTGLFLAEAALFFFFIRIAKRRIASRLSANPKQTFLSDFVLRSLLVIWLASVLASFHMGEEFARRIHASNGAALQEHQQGTEEPMQEELK